MYPGQQGQPGPQGQPGQPHGQPGQGGPQGPYQGGYPPQQPYPPQQGGPYPPQQPYPYQGQGPYQGPGPYPPPQGQQYPPQQPYPPQHPQHPQQPQQQGPRMSLGEGEMRIDPNLNADQRALVIDIQKNVKVYVLGFFFGVPLTAGGIHYAISENVKGLVAALVGVLGLALGSVFWGRAKKLKERLRQIMPDAWRSPAAHLQSARKAATLAAYLNGLLCLLALGATGYLLVLGAGWGAYGNSFGFAALVTGAGIPLSLALAAASTIPQLLRVVPAGAKVGQSLYSVLMVLGATIAIRGDGIMPKVVGGGVALICLGAVTLLGKSVKRMRGE